MPLVRPVGRRDSRLLPTASRRRNTRERARRAGQSGRRPRAAARRSSGGAIGAIPAQATEARCTALTLADETGKRTSSQTQARLVFDRGIERRRPGALRFERDQQLQRRGLRRRPSLDTQTSTSTLEAALAPYHFVRLARNLMKGAFPLLPVEVYICRTTPPAHTSHVWSPMASWDHCGRPSAIRIAPWCRDDLRALGFGMSTVDCRLERLATG